MTDPVPPPLDDGFAGVLARIQAMHDLKGADYGNEETDYANIVSSKEWGIPPWVAALIRAGDKIKRLQRFLERGKLYNESVKDSLIDNATYGVIAMVLYDKEAKDAA